MDYKIDLNFKLPHGESHLDLGIQSEMGVTIFTMVSGR